jgi:VanZ family protein
MTKRVDYRFLVLALAWMTLIFWFSSQSVLASLPDSLLDAVFKKSAHMMAYAVLWALWWLATGRRTWLALAITVGYAVSDEFHQTFVPGRNGWWVDVLIDTTGALLAILFSHSQLSRKLLARFSLG